MTEKLEALRLADVLDADMPIDLAAVAAELRRLHELLEAEQAMLQRVTYPELQRLRAQRDALLEACKVALGIIGFGAEHDQISAAIAKITGEQL